jgi:16S rRNA processing protein RimM
VPELICVAQIGAPHGIRGEVRLKSFTADPLAVKDYGPLLREDGSAELVIESVRPAKAHLVARFRGVSDRNAAEQLTNLKLFIPRERLPPPEPDEYYHADLIGLSAVTPDGNEIGTVIAIHDFGAGDILELRLHAGGSTLMLPFTDVYVPSVDVSQRRIVVAPPPDASRSDGEMSDGEMSDGEMSDSE